MPQITLTLSDTPNGAVSIHSSFRPAVGHPCSPAQATALDMITRTQKQWGVHIDAAPGGLDLSSVQRLRPACNCWSANRLGAEGATMTQTNHPNTETS